MEFVHANQLIIHESAVNINDFNIILYAAVFSKAKASRNTMCVNLH